MKGKLSKNAALENQFSHQGVWFPVRESFFFFLTPPEVMLLSYLLGESCRYKAWSIPKKKGWFFNTEEKVKKRINMSRSTQERTLNKLKGRGLVETKRGGVKGKRHFRIDLDALYKKDAEIRLERLDDDAEEPDF